MVGAYWNVFSSWSYQRPLPKPQPAMVPKLGAAMFSVAPSGLSLVVDQRSDIGQTPGFAALSFSRSALRSSHVSGSSVMPAFSHASWRTAIEYCGWGDSYRPGSM